MMTPSAGRWHLPVGLAPLLTARMQRPSSSSLPDETRVVSTHGLWVGHGRMLRQRWLETPIDDVRRDVEDALAGRSVVAGGDVLRVGASTTHIIPIRAGEWGLPLVESGL